MSVQSGVFDLSSNSVLTDSLIMMVDDEPIMIDLIQAFLEDAGYDNFLGQSDSVCAVELVTNRKPDVLLLDLVMPDVTGFMVLEALRGMEQTRHLPIIVLTSSSDGATKLKALELGATDFLAKPVDPSELVLRVRNILTVKAYQDQLIYLDVLTGLPNRKLFLERLASAIESTAKTNNQISVIAIRLSTFKAINDSFGPKVGDDVLNEASLRLQNCLSSMDMCGNFQSQDPTKIISKISGDEFSILLYEELSDEELSCIAERLIKAFEAPFIIDQHSLYITISLGIAMSPRDGNDADIVLKNASYAAHHSYDEMPGPLQFYSQEANLHLQERLQMQQDLKKAIKDNEFYLVFQPQVDAFTGTVKGAEALLRWARPDKAIISPAIFVPIAEQSGLMEEIGSWVLMNAFLQAANWQQQAMNNVSISINVSSKQFRADGFVALVDKCLQDSKVRPESVVIEMTESLAMSDITKTNSILHQLKGLGLKVSVDDFGTGYSSLSYLKSFPLNELKIDKTFVDGLPDNKGDQAITSAIITMAKKLNFLVVAEGVENQEQADYLAIAGCDLFQGYHFARPLSVDAFKAYYDVHS